MNLDYELPDRGEIEDTNTLEETIIEGYKKELTHYNMSILAISEDGRVEYPINNLFYEFLDILATAYSIYTIDNPLEKSRYKYRPDLFAYDKYGDKDLDWVVLAINGIMSAKDFTMNEIKVIDPEYLVPILSNILNAGQEYKDSNRLKYKEDGHF